MKVPWTSSKQSKCCERNGQRWCRRRYGVHTSRHVLSILQYLRTFLSVCCCCCCFFLRMNITSAIRPLSSTLAVLITMQHRRRTQIFPRHLLRGHWLGQRNTHNDNYRRKLLPQCSNIDINVVVGFLEIFNCG